MRVKKITKSGHRLFVYTGLLLFLLFSVGMVHASLNVTVSGDHWGYIKAVISSNSSTSCSFSLLLKQGKHVIVGKSFKDQALPYVWTWRVYKPGKYELDVVDMDDHQVYREQFAVNMSAVVQEQNTEQQKNTNNLSILIVVVAIVIVVVYTVWLLFFSSPEGKK